MSLTLALYRLLAFSLFCACFLLSLMQPPLVPMPTKKSTTTGSKAHAKKLKLTNAHQKPNWIRSNKPTSDQIKLHWRIGGWNPWEMVPEIRVHRAPLDFLSLLPRRSATPWPGIGFGWFNIDLMCCWGLFFCFGYDSQKWDDSDKEESLWCFCFGFAAKRKK